MPGSVLVDTNILIAYFSGERSIVERMKLTDEVCVSVIALGELFFGAKKSSRTAENIQRIKRFMQGCVLIQDDFDTAVIYGELKNQLRKKGRPIPDNDLWVAAIARQFGLPLATRDKHFQNVENLAIETW